MQKFSTCKFNLNEDPTPVTKMQTQKIIIIKLKTKRAHKLCWNKKKTHKFVAPKAAQQIAAVEEEEMESVVGK